jgi:alpha-beta hydrolase superfamily lysophospholipase
MSALGDNPAIVLIHGLWMTPRSWEHWIEHYQRRGYRVLAPAYPGLEVEVEALREDPSPIEALSVPDTVAHLEGLIRGLERPPFIMGHSFGGVLTQILLDHGLGAAGVAIDSVPAEVDERYHVAAPGSWIWGGVLANLTPGHHDTWVNFSNDERAPLLFIAGGADHIMPAAVNKANAEHYAKSRAHTDFQEFEGRSHFTVGQPGWEEVADFALNWCNEHTGRGILSTA